MSLFFLTLIKQSIGRIDNVRKSFTVQNESQNWFWKSKHRVIWDNHRKWILSRFLYKSNTKISSTPFFHILFLLLFLYGEQHSFATLLNLYILYSSYSLWNRSKKSNPFHRPLFTFFQFQIQEEKKKRKTAEKLRWTERVGRTRAEKVFLKCRIDT